MFFGRNKGSEGEVKAFVYINYGSDQIRHEVVKVPIGTSVLEALKAVADVQATPNESATGHLGSMVTSIDGFYNDIDHAWLYYVFERGESGWRIPKDMPDRLEVSDGMRIGWRLYNVKERMWNWRSLAHIHANTVRRLTNIIKDIQAKKADAEFNDYNICDNLFEAIDQALEKEE